MQDDARASVASAAMHRAAREMRTIFVRDLGFLIDGKYELVLITQLRIHIIQEGGIYFLYLTAYKIPG